MKLSNGAILNSNLSIDEIAPSVYSHFRGMSKIYIGQITEVFYTDDKSSISKRYVEYSVQVSEDDTTSLFRNCRALDSFGGVNNFQEHIYQKTTEGFRQTPNDKEAFIYKEGALVIVGFIGGDKDSPVILGAIQHPYTGIFGLSNGVSKFVSVGSSKSRDSSLQKLPTVISGSSGEDADNGGQRILGEFQGLRWNINKDGELTIVYQGPKNAKGLLTKSAVQPTIIKINKDGEIFLIDNLDQEIKISRKDQKIYISSGNKKPDFIEIVRSTKDITASCQHQIVTVAPKVSIGGKDAKEPLVLGNVWMAFYNTMLQTQLNPLIDAVKSLQATVNSHTHSFTWSGLSGTSTTIPGAPSNTAKIPPQAPKSSALQYSDFCFTKKKYSGS